MNQTAKTAADQVLAGLRNVCLLPSRGRTTAISHPQRQRPTSSTWPTMFNPANPPIGRLSTVRCPSWTSRADGSNRP